jgi:hypothetical protein
MLHQIPEIFQDADHGKLIFIAGWLLLLLLWQL